MSTNGIWRAFNGKPFLKHANKKAGLPGQRNHPKCHSKTDQSHFSVGFPSVRGLLSWNSILRATVLNSKNILISVLKMNGGLTGLERHEGE